MGEPSIPIIFSVLPGSNLEVVTCPCCLRAPVVLALAIATVFPAVSAVAQSGFSDLGEAGSHQADVENLAGKGVLEGTECQPGAFCPTDPLERWVMAVWLVRVLDGTAPPPAASRFVDVDPDTWWTPYVERLAVLGVTVGCATGPARFCPDRSVTRAQMATFLTRAIRRADLSTDLESASGRVVAGSFQVMVTFARDVTGFTADDVVVANGRVSGITGAGAGYEVTIAPAAAGTVVVRIPPGAAVDAAGNMSRGSEPLVRTFGWDGRGDAPGLDTWDRDAVVRSYRMEFDREEPDHGFTGNVDECDAGTISQAYRDSVVQRVNWYRRMAGVPAVTERAEFSVAAQHAALMMSAEEDLSHYPDSDWKCYSASGAWGAIRSNLGLGSSGVWGIDRYMRDTGSNNLAVGHRRWIVRPQLWEIGVGNVPYVSSASHYRANALYVELGGRNVTREQRGFIAWPPSGYIPAETVWGRWSFQLTGADFSLATVTVMDDDGPVPIQVISRPPGYYAPAVVWAVRGDTRSLPFPRPSDGDDCYTVTISEVRINGETLLPFQYATCLLDEGR